MAKKSCPSSVAEVSQTWPAMTTGVDQPRYGISVFHLTLFVSLQCSGRPTVLVSPGAEARPSPQGPRNSGQQFGAQSAPCIQVAATKGNTRRSDKRKRHITVP